MFNVDEHIVVDQGSTSEADNPGLQDYYNTKARELNSRGHRTVSLPE